MRRLAALSLIAFGLLCAPAQAKVRCTSGATILVDGRLRVFAVRHDTRLEHGWTEWACLGPRHTPVHVSDDIDAGEGGITTYDYAFAGGRYLVVASTNEGENGADGYYQVWDLRGGRGKTVGADWDFDRLPRLRLSPYGDIVAIEAEDLLEVIPLHGKRRALSHAAHDLALAGTTAYWTEGGVPHSVTLGGPASTAPDDHDPGGYFDGDSRCERRPGTTLFAKGRVRVARLGRTLFACRHRHNGSLTLPSHLVPATLRIARDRWLAGVDTCSHAAFVFDLSSGRIVTELPFERRWDSALLDDGTLAWIDDAGTLFAQAPDSGQATTLEATGASALASAGRMAYWTAGGAPHSWTAPAPSPAPGAGDFAGCS